MALRSAGANETSLKAVLTRIDTLDGNWKRQFDGLKRKVTDVQKVQKEHAAQLATLHPLSREQQEALADLTGRRVARAFLIGVLKSWKGRAVGLLTFLALFVTILGGIVEILRALPR